jgi:predicted Zn-dependent peptidase
MRSELMFALLWLAPFAHAAGTPQLPQPAVPPPPAWQAPTPASVTANGVRVVVLTTRNVPLVHVAVTVQAGSALDPADKPGLASLTARMLEEGGSGTRSGAELAEAIEDLGSEIEVRVDEDGVRFAVSVMSTKLDRALALLADLVTRPRFDATEWPAVRARAVSEITRELDRPTDVAENVFMKVLYGDHPYGHPTLGTRASVEKLSLEDVQAFWRSHYGPQPTSVVLVGDATIEGAQRLVSTAFAGWKSTVTPPAPPRAPTPPTHSKLVLVDRPGATQSALMVGRLGLAWSTPDFAVASLLEMVLGGSFTSRLNQNLRERHGFTYGVHNNFRMLRATGPFEISAAVRTDATAPSVAEMFTELGAMHRPLPVSEINKGRALVTQRVVEEFGQGSQVASLLGDLVLGDRSLDTPARLEGDLARLDAANVTRVADRLFPAEGWIVVVVGDRKVIEPKLRALPIGKMMELRDAEGNPTH